MFFMLGSLEDAELHSTTSSDSKHEANATTAENGNKYQKLVRDPKMHFFLIV